jgi:hypothetical protein
LGDRKAAYERALAKCEEYVARVILPLGTDAKGKHKKLEGNTVTFSVRACPSSVAIYDQTQVPLDYQTATVTIKMPAAQWKSFLDTLDLETRARLVDAARVEFTVAKAAVRAALDAEHAVPGAAVAPAKYSLVRK